jgi:hypothetical protein
MQRSVIFGTICTARFQELATGFSTNVGDPRERIPTFLVRARSGAR